MSKQLSRQQLDVLRYASGRQLYAADINGGDGNRRCTLLSLLKLGMLDWDPIYHGRVVLTERGTQQLADAHTKKLAAVRGTIDDPRSAVRIAKRQREDAAKEIKP